MNAKFATKRNKKLLVHIAICILSLLVLLLLVLPSIIVFFVTNGHVDYGVIENHPLQKTYHPSDFNLQSNEMVLTTEEGYKIWTSEVPTQTPKAVIIYLSGIRQPSVTYYYGHAKWMQENGYASFLLEVRGHGKSDGDKVCLGYEEVSDVKAVVDYIKKQDCYSGVPIVIQGVSMGGSIAINAFGQIEEINGLIAASAYSRFEDVVDDTMKLYHIPSFIRAIEKPLVKLALRFTFGNNTDELSPITQIQNIGNRPALLIASANDTEVSAENMFRLLDAAPKHCQSWLRETDTAGHFIIDNYDFENIALDTEYCERILDFLEGVIQNNKVCSSNFFVYANSKGLFI